LSVSFFLWIFVSSILVLSKYLRNHIELWYFSIETKQHQVLIQCE
jgi:hypothetical protein